MELYVHIPFCRSKCIYCDFASFPHRESMFSAYVDHVLKEAETRAEALNHPSFETVFIGGGTPSILPADEFDRLLTGLHQRLHILPDCEFTSECNPGTVTEAWLDAAIRGGVNRLSMGMQAYQPRLLRFLGRIHTFEDVAETVRLAREKGIHNISLDLMFGLPGQTIEDWRETLEAALSLQPQHLSCYGLIPEEGTPLWGMLEKQEVSLPDEDTEREMYDAALSTLAAHGFQQYEISNFALSGCECRHNLGYWRQVPYLGIGAAASSMLPSPSCAYRRETNPQTIEEYLHMVDAADSACRETEDISEDDSCFETMMLALRTTEGVRESDYLRMHSHPVEDRYGKQLRSLMTRGLIAHEDGCYRLTRRGMDIQNSILVELMD